MPAYYNENEPYAAQWLRNLISKGLIAPGDVDERSIVEVKPEDLNGYTQCHFFAGIGVWSHSLRAAGWDDSRPVWTGSCPCQPFSSAGKRKGASDERHLWPHLFRLIQACRPVTVFGEQVASSDGLQWLDLVQADLEGAGYASGAVDTCAAGFGAPHIRQRLYWVAHSNLHSQQRELRGLEGARDQNESQEPKARRVGKEAGHCGADGGLAHAEGERERADQPGRHSEDSVVLDRTGPGSNRCDHGADDGLADALPAGRTKGWTGTGDGPTAGSGEPDGLAHSQRAQEHQELNRPEVHEGERSADGIGRRGLVERLAHSDEDRRPVLGTSRVHDHGQGRHDVAGCGEDGRMGNPDDARREGDGLPPLHRSREGRGEVGSVAGSGADSGVAHASPDGLQGRLSGRQDPQRPTVHGSAGCDSPVGWTSPTHGFWGSADWLYCRDGRWRPVEPGTFPLAHGASARVGRLRAYGNAIVAPQAQAFVTAYLDVLNG